MPENDPFMVEHDESRALVLVGFPNIFWLSFYDQAAMGSLWAAAAHGEGTRDSSRSWLIQMRQHEEQK